MKILKDPDQVLQIMNRKLDKLNKEFNEVEDELETLEIVGEDASITSIAWYIRHTIEAMAASMRATWRASTNTLPKPREAPMSIATHGLHGT